jgi:hypothetical protein
MSLVERVLLGLIICVFAGIAVDVFALSASEVVAQYERPDIHLNWDHANMREDGTPLDLSKIQGYKLYYSRDAGEEVVVSLPPTTSYTINDVDSGLYSFQISTVAEIEGRRSEVVKVEIPSASPLFPEIRVTLELCNASGDCISQEVAR